MNFTLQILGSASARPTSEKNPSAQVLTVHGRLFLIDCGEGTQQRMCQMHLSFIRVQAVFISHIHGDHIFGLFGFLSTMVMLNRVEPLHIFGPGSLRPILKFYLSYFAEGSNYQIEFHEVKVSCLETVFETRHLRVSAFPLSHKIECYGYRFDELRSERELAKRAAVSYAYCSDTAPFAALPEYVRGVSVLYHEATYPRQYASKAPKYYHSSTVDAARCAFEAGVGKLLIGHYSSREKDIKVYEAECREIFPNTVAVKDGDVIEID